MFAVTGTSGFIGSVVASSLMGAGVTGLIRVDTHRTPGVETRDPMDFLRELTAGRFPQLKAIIHMGACAATTEMNIAYLEENNTRYTRRLAEYCLAHGIRFIYASSGATYGDGSRGFSDAVSITRQLRPLNPYGWSKHHLDLWAMEQRLDDKIVGLKFFNVYGPNEYHKGEMASVIYKAFHQIRTTGELALFKSYRPDFADGEQLRDFIYVKDCARVVRWFLDHPQVNGLFNVGTGQARTWNDLARATFSAMGRPTRIRYIDMPLQIRDSYQYVTQACMEKLRAVGYQDTFTSLEMGVEDYVRHYLMRGERRF